MTLPFNPKNQANIFTIIDLYNAHHLVHIREGDERKIAFNTSLGHIEHQLRLFGQTNAPAVFLLLINDVLQDI